MSVVRAQCRCALLSPWQQLTNPGVLLINVTQAIGEMSILYPVSGGFYTLASRMLDPSFAFAMGWNCESYSTFFFVNGLMLTNRRSSMGRRLAS